MGGARYQGRPVDLVNVDALSAHSGDGRRGADPTDAKFDTAHDSGKPQVTCDGKVSRGLIAFYCGIEGSSRGLDAPSQHVYLTMRLKMHVEAVLFDVDGTLIDSVLAHAKAWHEAFSKHGFEIDVDVIRSQIGKGTDMLVPDLLGDADTAKKLMPLLSKAHGQIFHDKYLPHVRGFPGVADFFSRLRRDGKKLALASSARGEELAQFKKIAGIGDFELPQTSSDDVEKSKPHPDIFQAASKALGGVEPSKCVVVGDSPYDVRAAKRAGMHTVGVLCGGFAEKDLRSAGCDLVYDDIAALYESYGKAGDAALIG